MLKEKYVLEILLNHSNVPLKSSWCTTPKLLNVFWVPRGADILFLCGSNLGHQLVLLQSVGVVTLLDRLGQAAVLQVLDLTPDPLQQPLHLSGATGVEAGLTHKLLRFVSGRTKSTQKAINCCHRKDGHKHTHTHTIRFYTAKYAVLHPPFSQHGPCIFTDRGD